MPGHLLMMGDGSDCDRAARLAAELGFAARVLYESYYEEVLARRQS